MRIGIPVDGRKAAGGTHLSPVFRHDGLPQEPIADVSRFLPEKSPPYPPLNRIGNLERDLRHRLAKDILMRADIIEEIKDKIKERAPEIGKEYADKFRERVNELLEGKLEVPEERVLVEAAVFADKANITEELVRLESHIQQLRNFFDTEEETVGKKIDFLIQEMNREANTIGSKSNDTEITSWMLDLKAEIEKIREQVQNIE